jgi:hypothetical protein
MFVPVAGFVEGKQDFLIYVGRDKCVGVGVRSAWVLACAP